MERSTTKTLKEIHG